MMKKSILLVEEDKALSDMYKLKFSNANYQIATRDNAKEALYWLSRNTPDCVIVDILLPGTNGISLIKAMRQSVVLKNTKIVILTNLTQPDINLHNSVRDSLGVDAYFVKTRISPSQLVQNIDLLLSANKKQ